MVAAEYNIHRVGAVIGLVPVDQNPTELLELKDNPTVNLNRTQAEVYLLYSKNGDKGGLFSH